MIDFYCFNKIKKKMVYCIFILFFLDHINLLFNNKTVATTVTTLTPIFTDTNIIDFQSIILIMLDSVSFFNSSIVNGSLVLVNVFKNNTNNFLQTIKITNTVIDLISKNVKQYRVVNLNELYCMYRELEISLEEISHSYEFAMRIADYLKAEYILYGIVSGDLRKIDITLQLILSSTGEILHIVEETVQNKI